MPSSRNGIGFGGKPATPARRRRRRSCWMNPSSAIIWPRGSMRSASTGRRPCPIDDGSERAGEGAAIEQDVLPGDEAGLGASQESAGEAELLGVADAPGGVGLAALGNHLLDGDAAFFRFRLGDGAA